MQGRIVTLFVCTLMGLSAANGQDRKVTVCRDISYGSVCQSFGPGVYRGNPGVLDESVGGVGNDAISSVKVPFGMSVDAFDNVGDHFDGSGDHYYFTPGMYPDLRDLPVDMNGNNPDMNDKISLLIVHDFAATYFSTNDPTVPSDFSISIDNGGTLNIHLSFGGGQHHKTFDYDVPAGCTPVWHESTKDGVAGDSAKYTAQTHKFHIDLWVAIRGPFSNDNWAGIAFSCAPALPVEITQHIASPAGRAAVNERGELRESPH